MAVIVDVVYNQATGAHPYAKLYWDSANNKTASDNPWFNVDARIHTAYSTTGITSICLSVSMSRKV